MRCTIAASLQMSDEPKKRAKRGFIVHVSAVRPLRYRLRVQIYEFLLIRPPASAVFFVPRSRFHPFATTLHENLRTFSRNPSTFVPKSTAFCRPSPTLRNRLRHAKRKPPFHPFPLTRALRALSIFRFLPSHLHPPQQPTHAQQIRGEGFTLVFPSPCTSSAAPLAPSHRPRAKVAESGEDRGAR